MSVEVRPRGVVLLSLPVTVDEIEHAIEVLRATPDLGEAERHYRLNHLLDWRDTALALEHDQEFRP